MRRVLSAVVVVMTLLALSASPAPAKGPSNMLLVAPTSGESVFMSLDDPRFAEIEGLLDDVGERVEEPVYEQWHEVHVAWTMAAIDIWRADIVFLDGQGEAVVMTVRSMLEGEGFSTHWRRVEDGVALTGIMGELGLLPGADGNAGEGAEEGTAESSAAAPAVAAEPTTSGPASPGRTDEASGWFAADGWGWTIPGLLAGLVLGVAGVGALRRRTPQAVAQRLASS